MFALYLLHHYTVYLHICCIPISYQPAYHFTQLRDNLIFSKSWSSIYPFDSVLSKSYKLQLRSSRCRCLLLQATRPTKGPAFSNKAAMISGLISLINSLHLIQSTMRPRAIMLYPNRCFRLGLPERIASVRQLQACLADLGSHRTIPTTHLRPAATSTLKYLGELLSQTVSFSVWRISH